MNFECHQCRIPFIRPYRMNITRASRPQFCSKECVARHSQAKADQRFAQRFWSRVDRGAENVCWPWTGRTDSNGYGRIDWKGKPRLAHRVAFFLSNPDADPECHACHSCDNPPCCNPSHLWGGTHRDNMDDMAKKGRSNCPAFAGEDHPCSKLTNVDVLTIRSSKERPVDLAHRYQVTPENIRRIQGRKTWRHI